jgi:hypothetical protein
MNNQNVLYGALVESGAGNEAFLCSVEHPKDGYVSLHFTIVIPIKAGACVLPPEDPRPLTFLEEVRVIGHALELYRCHEAKPNLQELIRSKLLREYGTGAKVDVRPIDAPELVGNLFNLSRTPDKL